MVLTSFNKYMCFPNFKMADSSPTINLCQDEMSKPSSGISYSLQNKQHRIIGYVEKLSLWNKGKEDI